VKLPYTVKMGVAYSAWTCTLKGLGGWKLAIRSNVLCK